MNEVVKTGIHLVRNLGNYNSMRLETSYETQVNSHENETVEEAFSRAWLVVEQEIEKKSNEYELDN